MKNHRESGYASGFFNEECSCEVCHEGMQQGVCSEPAGLVAEVCNEVTNVRRGSVTDPQKKITAIWVSFLGGTPKWLKPTKQGYQLPKRTTCRSCLGIRAAPWPKLPEIAKLAGGRVFFFYEGRAFLGCLRNYKEHHGATAVPALILKHTHLVLS